MTTSIFIKTYHRDHQWLQYLLPSIEKYSEGFESVVIISDDDGNKIPNEYLNTIKKIPIFVHYVPLPQIYPPNIIHGLGYLWQQYIKLNWMMWCSSQSILILDSDEMLTQLITPNSFKYNDKWIWSYRPWSEAGDAICWKEHTDNLLKINTPYEAMCITGFIMTISATRKLLDYINEIYSNNDLWNIINEKHITTLSEFNIYGSFIYHTNNEEYYYNINRDIPLINQSILKYWSWGGISSEIHNKNISYL
jgi:hypothetical protein